MSKDSIFIGQDNYGEIGKQINRKKHSFSGELYVGDIISFIYNDQVMIGTVLNEDKANTFGVYGVWSKGLRLDSIKKVYDYRETTNEQKLSAIKAHNIKPEIIKDAVKEHTLEEIQRLLGYKVKIVK